MVWSLHLTKVELHSTVVADDVGEKGLAVQGVLADLEGDGWFPAILREGQHCLLTFKVLSQDSKRKIVSCVVNTKVMKL